MKNYCFGIDIGGTAIKFGLFQTNGVLLEKWEIPTPKENQSETVIPAIANVIQEKLKEQQIQKEDVEGIGFGMPGPVSSDGVSLNPANFKWTNKPVAKELSELTGFLCKGGNDVKTAGFGEIWKGAASGYQNVVLITLGTGVGSAIICNGNMLVGSKFAAGEVGHIHVDDEIQTPCGCGAIGCAEQFGSAPAVVRMAKELLVKSKQESILRSQEITAKSVFDAVKKNDALAIQVAEKFGKALGISLAATAAVVDPEIFIVGGGLSKAGTVILEYIQKYYIKYVWPGCRDKRFALAELGNDAGIYGAASYIVKR